MWDCAAISMIYNYMLQHKYETFEKFKEFKAQVEKRLVKNIKSLHKDRGGRYFSYESRTTN